MFKKSILLIKISILKIFLIFFKIGFLGQGGMAHVEAEELATNPATSQRADLVPKLYPTQRSFVEHLCAWKDAYKSVVSAFTANLPLPSQLHDPNGLGEPVSLLLGTAGTGKTTTLQAANRVLEQDGLQNRIVRCAYTPKDSNSP